MTRKIIIGLCSAFVALALAGPRRFAHHGAAAYDPNQTTIKGTVAEFDFINPHCQLYIDAPDDSGKMVKWDGEFTNAGTRPCTGAAGPRKCSSPATRLP